MTEDEVLTLLRDTGVLMEGHFQLSSGRHSHRYLQCARVLQYPVLAERLGRELAGRWRDVAGETGGISAVVGPALGGILVAYEVARGLGARALFTERQEGRMTLRRGFTIAAGEAVLVVEDVITTGGSVREVLEVVSRWGGRTVGVGALVDRSGGLADLSVPVRALASLTMESYPPADCPLCRRGVPVQKPGSRTVPAS